MIDPKKYYDVNLGDAETLTDYGFNLAFDLARDVYRAYMNDTGKNFNMYKMAAELDFYKWKITEGEYRGTIPNRMDSWTWKKLKWNIPEELKTRIGNKLSKNLIRFPNIRIDFTKCFDWDDGAFMDGGSCLWHGRSYAKDSILPHLGAWAMRVWLPEDSDFENDHPNAIIDDGYVSAGRCWLIPTENTVMRVANGSSIEPKGFVAINGYGPGWLNLEMMAQFIKKALELECIAEVGEIICSTTTMWVNNDSGVYIGEQTEKNLVCHLEYTLEDDPAYEPEEEDDWDDQGEED